MRRAAAAPSWVPSVALWAAACWALAGWPATSPRAEPPDAGPSLARDSAEVSPPASVREARRLLVGGEVIAAASMAAAQLSLPLAPTRADSLRRIDWLEVAIESRLRAGNGGDDSTRVFVGALAEIERRSLQPDDPGWAIGLDLQGKVLRGAGDRTGAEKCFSRALDIRTKALGPRDPETAKSLCNLAMLSYDAGDLARARDLFRRALAIQEEKLPRDSPDLAATLTNLIRVRSALGDTAQVREHLDRAQRIRERSSDADSCQVAATLHDRGAWERSQGEYAEAAGHLERALALREHCLPGQPPLAETLRELASLEMDRGGGDPEPMLERARAIFSAALGANDPQAAYCTMLLGQGRQADGRYVEAQVTYDTAFRALEGPPVRDSLMLATCLQSLASAAMQLEQHDLALKSMDRALSIRLRHYGPEHVQVARALVASAAVLRAMDHPDSASTRCQRALRIVERSLGPDNVLVAEPLVGLAESARESGDLARARELDERALHVRERKLGNHHVKVAECLHLLGILERDLGDPAAAESSLTRARAILEASGSGSRAELADVLGSLGALYRRTNRMPEALELYERSLALAQGALGPEHRSVAIALRNLGSLANSAGDWAAGESYFRRALAAIRGGNDRSNPDLGPILIGLANARKGRGDLDTAIVLYRRALAIQVASLGPDHPALALGLHNLAGALLERGARTAALDTALLAEELTRRQLRVVARGLSEQEALHYAATRVRGLDIALTAALRLRDYGASARAWDGVIRSRAQVLDEMADRRRAIAAAHDPALAALSAELATASGRLANLIVRGRGSTTSAEYQALIDRRREEEQAAQRALAERSEPVRLEQARHEVGLREVVSALPEDAALVAYVRYTRLEGRAPAAGHSGNVARGHGTSSYAAFVIPGGREAVRLVDLGPAESIEAEVERWRVEAAEGPVTNAPDQAEALYRATGASVRRAIWDSVAVRLGSPKRVFIVPDGALHAVNLAALPADDGGYLLESGPLLHLLSAERDLVLDARGAEAGIGLFASASPDYDLAPGREAATRPAEPASQRRRGAHCTAFRSLSFDSLPGTRVEARAIVNLWNRYHSRLPDAPTAGRARRQRQVPVTELLGASATERAFKLRAPGHHVLHVATHAFTLGGDCAGRDANDASALSEEDLEDAPVREQNPLLLCGLALAGANRRAEASSSEDDGILTGEEIASLDLSSVDWAVLSACQTGLGEVTADEGVFGLRRAFQIAGARTLIMTLWAVRDQDAALWMDALYVNRLKESRTTAEAVREASLAVLRSRRSHGLSTHPFYWGAFVAAGGWN